MPNVLAQWRKTSTGFQPPIPFRYNDMELEENTQPYLDWGFSHLEKTWGQKMSPPPPNLAFSSQLMKLGMQILKVEIF